MKHLQRIIFSIIVVCILCVSVSCGKKYTVKFINDNETIKEFEVKKGEKVSAEAVSKNGYEFVGWFLNDELYDFDLEVKSDITLSSKWNAINYNIIYDMHGGVNNESNPASYSVEDEVVLSAPTKEGNNFLGWLLNDELVTKIPAGTTGELKLEAVWLERLYNIVYHLDGGENNFSNPTSYTVKDNVIFREPIKNGYNFIGWYSNDKLITEISVGSTGDFDVFAMWEIVNYNINYHLNGGTNIETNPNTFTVEDEVVLLNPKKEGFNFVGWFIDEECTVLFEKIEKGTTDNIDVYAKWESAGPRFTVSGTKKFYDEGTTKLTAKLSAGVEQPTYTWNVENEEVALIDAIGKNYVTLYGTNPGKTIVYVTATYPDGTVEYVEVEVEVLGNDFDITYELNQNDALILPSDAITTYNTGEMPVKLPVLERDYYVFAGWMIEGYEGIFTELTLEDNIDGNLILSPKWLYPHMKLSFDNNLATVELNETVNLLVETFDFDENVISDGFIYKSLNKNIVTIDEDGIIYGVALGYAEIIVCLKEDESINTSIGITVTEQYTSMNEVLAYFVSIAESNNIVKNIKVTGWQRIYSHELRTSVIGYLFEDLVITENIAPLGNGVRPGTITKKEYICVHDTGDVDFTAKDWSNTVYNNYNPLTGKTYGASYQYVIDAKDCYHNIPDNERSFHAGDGNRSYEEIASGIYGTDKYPTITITDDGYYAINGEKSTIVAPTGPNGEILKTSDINDYGIRCVIRDGQYYLGKTWYSETYRKIGNYGGNNNSIGIESCVTEGDDIYYTWQRLAKLVAKLMDENDLTIDDVVTHHYFSGKNCPQTMREAGFYMHFKKLVEIEYTVLQFVKQGYNISFVSNNTEYVNNLGRVIKTSPVAKTVSYTINVEKDGITNSITLSSVIQFTPYL